MTFCACTKKKRESAYFDINNRGSKGQSTSLLQKQRQQIESQIGRHLNANIPELNSQIERFLKFANQTKNGQKHMDLSSFKEMLGILGTYPISDRIFQAIDDDRDQLISLVDYLKYNDVLTYGDALEKNQNTFKMIDLDRDGIVEYKEFKIFWMQFIELYSEALQVKLQCDEDQILSAFNLISLNQSTFNFVLFNRAKTEIPELFEWIEQPGKYVQEFMKQHQKSAKVDLKVMETYKNESIQSLQKIKREIDDAFGINNHFKSQNIQLPKLHKNRSNTMGPKQINRLQQVKQGHFANNHNSSFVELLQQQFRQSQVVFSNSPLKRSEVGGLVCADEKQIYSDYKIDELEESEFEISQHQDNVSEVKSENENDDLMEFDDSDNKSPSPVIQKIKTTAKRQIQTNALTNIHLMQKSQSEAPVSAIKLHKMEIPQEDEKLNDQDSVQRKQERMPSIAQAKYETPSESFIHYNDIVEPRFQNGDGIDKGKKLELEKRVNSKTEEQLSPLQPLKKSQHFNPQNEVKVKKIKAAIDWEIDKLQAIYEEEKEKALEREIKSQKQQQSKRSQTKSQNIPQQLLDPSDNVGQFIRMGDEKFDLILNIMIGIKKSVANLIEIPFMELTDRQFKLKYKIENQWIANDHKKDQSVKSFKFFDYAPYVFQRIRRLSDIVEEDYLKSLGPDSILNCFWTNNYSSLYELCSSGKSGSLFYYTEDHQFMLKTISRDEFKKLKDILKPYYTHIENNPHTLITRFYGLHQIKWMNKQQFNKKYLVVMNNVFRDFDVGVRFDLKGSKQSRKVLKDGQTLQSKDINFKIALKDLDFVEHVKKLDLIQYDFQGKPKLEDILEKDAKFFMEQEIIDYSLLLGFINDSRKIQDNRFEEGFNDKGLYFDNNDQAYVVGIIDILTEFNGRKKFEYAYKWLKYRMNMSCIPPKQYADRYVKFMKQSIETHIISDNANSFHELDIAGKNII